MLCWCNLISSQAILALCAFFSLPPLSLPCALQRANKTGQDTRSILEELLQKGKQGMDMNGKSLLI
jgi:hypothetical protein